MPIVTEKQPTPERSENDANVNTNTSKGTSCPFHVATPPSPDMSSDKTHSHVGYENGSLGQNGNEDLAHNGDDHSQVESSLESSPHSSPVQNGNESVPPPREDVKVSSKEKKQYKLFQSPKEKKELQDDYEAICLKILLPGQSECIDVIQIAKDTVNDLLQYSFEKPECCYRTCLSLRFNGKKLDNFAELGSIKDLKNGSTIEIVEEPYTLRDVMIHIERLQELLSPHSLQLSLSCINGLSLSFLSIVVQNTLENPS
jgi:protein TIF31